MPDKSEAEMQDVLSRTEVVCSYLLGLVERFCRVEQAPTVETSGNSDTG